MIKYCNPVQVAVFPFRLLEIEPEFLLTRRLLHGGGFQQGVTGGVEEGESIELAAARELKEETGFRTPVLSINYRFECPVQEECRRRYPPTVKMVVEHAFVAAVTALGDPKLSREHDYFKWLTFKEINLEDLKWKEIQAAIIKAADFIKKHIFSAQLVLPSFLCRVYFDF